ncbi:uncharacterized protein L201_003371 [Kwoniella dendrophila CBS 6074]|uniref:Alpha-1,6-mannosyltransferase n=1 Tax=Kwoniella dendrophila CBS 6074 TaxID=1295534 RepID=A0AAX4JV61_9TREE
MPNISFHGRYSRPVLLVLLITGLYFLSNSWYPSDSVSDSVCGIEDTSSCSTGKDDIILPSELKRIEIDLLSILQNVKTSIETSSRSYDIDYYGKELGFKIKTVQSIKEYNEKLRAIWSTYFFNTAKVSSEPDSRLDGILSYASIIPQHMSEKIPQNVYTTSLENPADLPEQFRSWTTNNPNWLTRFVNDDDIDIWLENLLPSSQVIEDLKWLKKNKQWGVVRSDLFRYLVLLLDGGVYTDTDTACVRPIENWGDNAMTHHSDNPLIEALPRLFALAQQNVDHNLIAAQSSSDDKPSLIVALEMDSPSLMVDWRDESFVRGIQIVQWTIASKPNHPVFLDVIGHALDNIKQLREAMAHGLEIDEDQDILEWSGPGAFTDAVFRYLLIRYGFHPKHVSGLDKPLRVGDVLIMPVHSFRADASEGYQGDNRVVWHGFFGRWKPENQ